MSLKAGDWVEIRSKEEILATLDGNGRLEELPFMPQMFNYCGKRFKVYKRAHKTCDTVTWTGGRRLENAVHLQLRCDGQAYGGCQAGCLLYWKEAWLKDASGQLQLAAPAPGNKGCTEDAVRKGTLAPDQPVGEEPRYICQATQVPVFTKLLPWWDVRQYVEDYTSGNLPLRRLFNGFVYLTYYHVAQTWRNRLGLPSRWLYDRFQALRGGIPYPRTRGYIPLGQPTPRCDLNLQPGELVRVKSHKEILATIDKNFFNRGLGFDAELVPNCGKIFRVQARVSKFIDEKTGRMRTLKTPAVILEGVWCESRYSNCKMFCPRAIYSWWREIWLERVSEPAQTRPAAEGAERAPAEVT
jgi:hypothetical protein